MHSLMYAIPVEEDHHVADILNGADHILSIRFNKTNDPTTLIVGVMYGENVSERDESILIQLDLAYARVTKPSLES